MLVLEISDISTIIARMGLQQFYIRLCDYLAEDFANWEQFQKSPRHAVYVENGVIELMPICHDRLYSFKYVNGHPNNPLQQKLNVVALGMLADVMTGYPILLTEMTLLTGLRTAATAALASRYLARENSKSLAIIGCGAQSEFQVLAHHALLGISDIRYFDIDPHAMQRFERNLQNTPLQLHPMQDVKAAIHNADLIVTATAAKGKQNVLCYDWLQPGQHLVAIGGDSPGKTELELEILKQSKIVVEYFPQTHHEGEIQNLGEQANDIVYAELWEIVSGKKLGRTSEQEITVFDSVGFALEDFSALRLCYQLAQEYNLGKNIQLIPDHMSDCKNLFGLLHGEQ